MIKPESGLDCGAFGSGGSGAVEVEPGAAEDGATAEAVGGVPVWAKSQNGAAPSAITMKGDM